jgi:hypothetical protein
MTAPVRFGSNAALALDAGNAFSGGGEIKQALKYAAFITTAIYFLQYALTAP